MGKKMEKKKRTAPKDPPSDPRFSTVGSDPKFIRMQDGQAKIGVDERFQSMFTDTKFSEKSELDKRGRPSRRTPADNLKDYYRLDSPKEPEKKEKKKRKKKTPKTDEKESDSSDDEEVLIDLARGEGNMSSSSEEESSSDDDAWNIGEEDGEEMPWGQLGADAPEIEEPTKLTNNFVSNLSWMRLAVCHMNWDRISARDLLVLFNSFKPPAAIIHRVKIYPSDFGKERMSEEALKGPAELVTETLPEPDEDQEEEAPRRLTVEEKEAKDREEKKQREKIRAYQIQRLRYYYAVVECDTAETANTLYDACNGVEYESSAEKMDLRFIPDDMEFAEDEVKDSASDVGDISKYEPAQYADSALQQVSVELTWDESDPRRAKALRQAFHATDEAQLDTLQEYLGSGSSSEDEDRTQVYRDLIANSDDVKPLFDKRKMEELKEEEGLEMKWTADDKDSEETVTDKQTSKKQRPWDAYLERRKEKKRAFKVAAKAKRDAQRAIIRGEDPPAEQKSKKEKNTEVEGGELDLLVSGEKIGRRNYNVKKLLKGEEDEFEPDLGDPRFAGLFQSHHFSIDPSDANFKATRGMKAILEAKVERASRKGPRTPAATAPKDWASTAAKLSAKAERLARKPKKSN